MIKNGIYIMKDFDNQETEIKVKENDKTITFELIGEKPFFTRGDMDTFIYNQPNKKRTIKKLNGGHAIRIWNNEKFTLYPFQSGNPYLFTYKK